MQPSASRLSPKSIAFIYAVVGGLWILASDRIVELIGIDPDTITHLQTYKGWFYVVMTALMLFGLIRSYGNRLRQSKQQEAFLADLLELSSQPFAVRYPDMRLGRVNTAFSELTGYSTDELTGIVRRPHPS